MPPQSLSDQSYNSEDLGSQNSTQSPSASMTAPLLTMMTSSLLNLCNETATILEPLVVKFGNSPVKPLYTHIRAVQTSLKQLHDALDSVPPTAIQEDVHAEVQSVLQAVSAAMLAAKRLATKFKGAESGSALERSWRTWRMGTSTAAAEFERVEKMVESSVSSLGLAATLVQRWDRPQAREGLLILLRGQASQRPKSSFVLGSVVPVSSSNSSTSCELPFSGVPLQGPSLDH